MGKARAQVADREIAEMAAAAVREDNIFQPQSQA